jgi:hypothetical protein
MLAGNWSADRFGSQETENAGQRTGRALSACAACEFRTSGSRTEVMTACEVLSDGTMRSEIHDVYPCRERNCKVRKGRQHHDGPQMAGRAAMAVALAASN